MSDIISTGIHIQEIKNRQYCRYDTENAEKTVHAFDICGIPYFAKYNNSSVSITYDGNYKSQVEEIIKKSESGDYEKMLSDVKKNGYKTVLPEIAEILKMSVNALNNRPDEIIQDLCTAYIKLWHCDNMTLNHELSEIIRVNNFI